MFKNLKSKNSVIDMLYIKHLMKYEKLYAVIFICAYEKKTKAIFYDLLANFLKQLMQKTQRNIVEI